MTGTALAERKELFDIYGLEVRGIPPNNPIRRVDLPDTVYESGSERDKALFEDVMNRHAKGQPCLIGATSISQAEHLSKLFSEKAIDHTMLTAKQDAEEARIIARAGRFGAITIATDIAGRGTDIILGGESSSQRGRVIEAGGLAVLGAGRHQARRIDEQLIGRSGRQGEPGSSQFFASLDDDIVRDHADSEAIETLRRTGLSDQGTAWSKKAKSLIDWTQRRIEDDAYAARKNMLDYDEVLDKQRKAVYRMRKVLIIEGLADDRIEWMVRRAARSICARHPEENSLSEVDEQAIVKELAYFGVVQSEQSLQDLLEDCIGIDESAEVVADALDGCIQLIRGSLTNTFGDFSTRLSMKCIDVAWQQHLSDIEDLKLGISLRSFGQRDPLSEFREDANSMFDDMIDAIAYDTIRGLIRWSNDMNSDS